MNKTLLRYRLCFKACGKHIFLNLGPLKMEHFTEEDLMRMYDEVGVMYLDRVPPPRIIRLSHRKYRHQSRKTHIHGNSSTSTADSVSRPQVDQYHQLVVGGSTDTHMDIPGDRGHSCSGQGQGRGET